MDQQDHEAIQRIANKGLAATIGQWLTPVLIIASITYMGRKMDSTDAKIDTITETQNKAAVTTAEMKGDIKALDGKMDSAVLYQVNDLKRRVDRLETMTKTP